MSMSSTFSVQTMEYEVIDREIKRTMRRSARDVVQLGFLLRQMMEKKMWEAAYDCFDEYLKKELHMDYSLATRFININRKYSVSGDSMEIAAEYEEYSQGLLIEMLNMPPELEAKVTPDMTVKQVREIKKRAKAKREAPARLPVEEKEMVIDGEYREIREPEEESIATSQPQPEAEKAHDESWFVEQYTRIFSDEAKELFEICRKEQNNSDRAKAVQKHISPYGAYSCCCSGNSFDFHGFAAGMDFRIGSEKIHLKYGRFVVELMKLMEKEVATSQPEEGQQEEKLSPYGLSKTVYPEGSLLTTVGCGHKYDCFSCAQDCAIRQEDRYCNGAPMGNPFSCTTMQVLENIRSEIGEQCQFINLDMAKHKAGSNEPNPCCKNCNNGSCGYRCRRSAVSKENIQPELPALKNNDQRKEWLVNYKSWGLWYRDENIDVNYYKYDFIDGSRLVVAEYPQRYCYWNGRWKDEHYFHLLEKDKKGYNGNAYDEQYRNQTDSETYLVEFLKNLQKKG